MERFKTLGNKLINIDEICCVVRHDGKGEDYSDRIYMIGVKFKNGDYQTIYKSFDLEAREEMFKQIENLLK